MTNARERHDFLHPRTSWSFIATQHQSPPLVDTALSFLPPSHGEIEIPDSCNGLLLLRCSGEEGDQQRITKLGVFGQSSEWSLADILRGHVPSRL
jgi:hypothetical protein